VPYGGTAPAATALMGGHVHAIWADFPTIYPQLKSGVMRGLVSTSPKRLEVLPGVPIMEETGITKYVAEIFYGIVAPAKTPPEALKNLTEMFTTAMNTPDMKAKFGQQGMFPDGACGAKFGTFLREITDDYERVTTAAGIKAN
jgi:tripartite-type tricarboxylate transporter receptor subunit TctC